ncbi:hypothetical protein [Paraburkholderia tropica]|uniref:hypothetical protein n=1 Tax=Paraburkholderia tropica TaxID=92647 RepID=UPI002AB63954|nr:hypothetical protein [Paraburkholderia tropica]
MSMIVAFATIIVLLLERSAAPAATIRVSHLHAHPVKPFAECEAVPVDLRAPLAGAMNIAESIQSACA